MTNNIGFIGAGNMTNALVSGLITSGHVSDNIMASSPETEHLEKIKKYLNCVTQ